MKKHIKPRPDCQQEKWNSSIEGLPFPSDIILLGKLQNLSQVERLFLHVLHASMNRENKLCWKSQARLADEMGCSDRAVREAGKRLEELGIIEVEHRDQQGKRSLKYSFNFPWALPDPRNVVPPPPERGSPYPERGSGGTRNVVPPPPERHSGGTRNEVPSNVSKRMEQEMSSSNGVDDDEPTGFFSEEMGRQEHEPFEPAPHEDRPPFLSDPVGWTKTLYPAFMPATETVGEFFGKFRSDYMFGPNTVDLGALIRPFKNGGVINKAHGLDLDTPLSAAYERQLQEFIAKFLKGNWAGDTEPRPGMWVELRRAGRFGVLHQYGFAPVSSGELARQDEERRRADEEWQRECEEAQAEDERKEEMERRLLEFCYQDGPHEYFQELGLLGKRTINLDRVRAHIRELKAEHGFRTAREIAAFMTDHVEALTARRERSAQLRDFSKMLSERPELYAVLTKLELLPGDVLPELLNRDEFGKAFDRFNSLADEHGFQSFEDIAEFLLEKAEKAA